jgi:hypothetical protein
MKPGLLSLLRKTPFYPAVRNRLEITTYSANFEKWQAIELQKWEESGGMGNPPHLLKQRLIREVSQTVHLKVLVETGTYRGDMVQALLKDFDLIYSIELSPELFNWNQQRFKGIKKVHLIQGDSGIELKNVVDQLTGPALFWLDGHYSGGDTALGDTETPIFKELGHIFNSHLDQHVIIIDDARCFGSEPGFPDLEKLLEFIRARAPEAEISIRQDAIIIIPGKK